MAEQRVARSDLKRTVMAAPYEDGILELLMALLFLVIAALWDAGSGELLAILAIPIIFAGGLALRQVKRRVTEPRIGHVEPRTADPSPAWHWLAFFGGGLVLVAGCAAIFGDVGSSESWVRWAPLLSGYLIAGAFHYLASVSGLRRYYALEGISLLVGASVSIASDGSSYSVLAAYFATMAGVVAVFGASSLIVFLMRHPRLDGPSDANGG